MINIIDCISKKLPHFEQALTHSSYSTCNYERLEFLGDSLLNYIVANHLFITNNDYNEGQLTKARANLVSKKHLSNIFNHLQLNAYVKIGKSLNNLTENIECDMFEALVAAIYLNFGLQDTAEFVINNIDIDYSVVLDKDSKSLLQERLQERGVSFSYNFEQNNDVFVCTLVVNNKELCSAEGKSKHESAQNCAAIALTKI